MLRDHNENRALTPGLVACAADLASLTTTCTSCCCVKKRTCTAHLWQIIAKRFCGTPRKRSHSGHLGSKATKPNTRALHYDTDRACSPVNASIRISASASGATIHIDGSRLYHSVVNSACKACSANTSPKLLCAHCLHELVGSIISLTSANLLIIVA